MLNIRPLTWLQFSLYPGHSLAEREAVALYLQDLGLEAGCVYDRPSNPGVADATLDEIARQVQVVWPDLNFRLR